MKKQESAVRQVLSLMQARDHAERSAMVGREAPATILYYGHGGGAGLAPGYFGFSPQGGGDSAA